MKRTDNIQINTKYYWDEIYSHEAQNEGYWKKTSRFIELLKYVKDGDKFLDMGCGVALPAKVIKENRKDCEIWGVDISQKAIDVDREKHPDDHYFQGYAGFCDFLPSEHFDVVFAGEIIEHMDTPESLFKEAYRILKAGGKLIVSTPRENAVESSEHVWEFTKEDMIKFYTDAGFKNVEFIEMPDLEHLVIYYCVGEK